jgi:hypothetical protein
MTSELIDSMHAISEACPANELRNILCGAGWGLLSRTRLPVVCFRNIAKRPIMYRSCMLLAVALTIFHVIPASAQESRLVVAQPEHGLLERFAGEWHFERLSPPGEELEPQSFGAGTISAEMVGDFFVVSRWSGTVYGLDYVALQSLGYDIERETFTGAWIDSFMSYRWELSGTVDEESQELTLTTRGPAPTGGTTAFRERYRFDSADSITILGEMQRGERWVPITTTRLTRRR